MNSIQYGKLKIVGKLGELMPRGVVGAGRGNKNPQAPLGFSEPTVTTYRKVADYKNRLAEYHARRIINRLIFRTCRW